MHKSPNNSKNNKGADRISPNCTLCLSIGLLHLCEHNLASVALDLALFQKPANAEENLCVGLASELSEL